ncbi:hypothetical protein [Actinoplanes sp. NPDC051411]|uniref:hypothetical protein n=1 Tax=Actinoplanes sp. NPDC051411 TaxID=3155522 RepID=UPI00342E20B6
MRIDWTVVGRDDVLRAAAEFDSLGATEFYARHGFAPATTYEMVLNDRRYPPKALLGTAFEFATGTRLASSDFEGGRAGAVRVLQKLGFDIRHS